MKFKTLIISAIIGVSAIALIALGVFLIRFSNPSSNGTDDLQRQAGNISSEFARTITPESEMPASEKEGEGRTEEGSGISRSSEDKNAQTRNLTGTASGTQASGNTDSQAEAPSSGQGTEKDSSTGSSEIKDESLTQTEKQEKETGPSGEPETQKDTASESGPQKESETESSEEAESSAETETQNPSATEKAGAGTSVKADHRIIFVGDSRTVGMEDSEQDSGDNCVYIAASGEGYSWFSHTGLQQMREAIFRYPDAPVVINLGVNDLSGIGQYLTLYSTFPAAYPGTTFYYMSVNPLTEDAVSVSDAEVVQFNSQLQGAFPELYIDTYTWLKTNGFESGDGVHYSEDTYRAIHDYVVSVLF